MMFLGLGCITTERKLDSLDKFTHVNKFHKFDNEIPHLERGVPILDQYLESHFVTPSPTHEEFLITSPEWEVHLDYVI